MSPKAIGEGMSPVDVSYKDFNPSNITQADDAVILKTDTVYRAATFIETYTGRAFWPLHPTMDALSVIDIAHALSNQCRYSGHVQFFYSVAQHCCLLASWLANHGGSPLECLQILMHDAPEAYLVDIPRPVKQYMPQYRVWDHAINDVIREWMGWKDLPILPIQDELDSRIIVDERAALMSRSGLDWGHHLEPVGIDIVPWTPAEAEKQFLMMYAAYSQEVYGSYQYINYTWNLPVTILHEANSDVLQSLDVMEVDVKGRVGRVRLRDDEGILVRDTTGGVFPRPQWKWVHGDFKITERG
jgi:hypothetical protein